MNKLFKLYIYQLDKAGDKKLNVRGKNGYVIIHAISYRVSLLIRNKLCTSQKLKLCFISRTLQGWYVMHIAEIAFVLCHTADIN